MNSVYERLKELRVSKNILGEETAKLIGVTKATYSKKENGIIKFSLEEAKIIAEKMGMQIEEVFKEGEI